MMSITAVNAKNFIAIFGYSQFLYYALSDATAKVQALGFKNDSLYLSDSKTVCVYTINMQYLICKCGAVKAHVPRMCKVKNGDG